MKMRARSGSRLGFVPLVATVALLTTGGCTSSGPYWSREDQGAAEATELRERVASLEAQLAAVGERNAALQARAEGLERELARTREGTAEPNPTPPARPFGTPEVPLAPGSRQEIEQSDLADLVGTDEPATPDPDPSDTTPRAAAEPEGLYERSLEFLEQGRLAEAEAGFVRFLAANPDSDLADNAQFWLAESALRRTDVESALAGFRAVVERFPEGNKVPDALLKVGACLAALGDADSAATVYRELVARFPDSAAAETARLRLGPS